MTTAHNPRNLRQFLPAKPDADTAFWLTVCGTAYAFGIAMAALLVGMIR